MSDHDLDEFAARIARPLKAPEQLEASFEARVMSGVLLAAQERAQQAVPVDASANWWRRRSLRLSPLGGLAIAAGLAGVTVLGTLGTQAAVERRGAPAAIATTALAPDTVHVVRFVLRDAQATAVALVGDFNGWAKDATPLVQEGPDGTWTASVMIPAGRHEYAFVVRDAGGEQWIADPAASTRIRDEFGVESSVVTVGRGGGDAAARPSAS